MVPTEAVRLNRGHPLAPSVLYVPGSFRSLMPYGNGPVLTPGVNGAPGGSPLGPGYYDNDPTSGFAYAASITPNLALNVGSINWLGFLWGAPNPSNSNPTCFGVVRNYASTAYCYQYGMNLGSTNTYFFINPSSSGGGMSITGGGLSSGQHLLTGTFSDTGNLQFYIDGVSQGITAWSGGATDYTGAQIVLGGDEGVSNRAGNATSIAAWIHPFILSVEQITQLAALPFSMLERAGRIAVWDVGGSVAFAISVYEKILGESLGKILFTDSPILEDISTIINSNNLLQENLISENAQTKLGIENLSQKISEASISSDQLGVTNNSGSIGEENLLKNNSNDNLLGELLASINSKDSLPNEYLVSFLLKNEFLLENSSSAVFSNSALAEMNLGLQINSLQIVDSLGSVVSMPVILIDGYVSGGIVLSANFLDAPQSFDNLYAWVRSLNRTLELKEINFKPQNSNDLLQTVAQQPNFKSKYTTDYLDYSWSFSDFGLSGDYLIQGNIINVTPSGSLGITSETLQQGKYFTIWVSGGTENTIYGITFQVVSNQGLVVIGTSWLPVLGVAPYNK